LEVFMARNAWRGALLVLGLVLGLCLLLGALRAASPVPYGFEGFAPVGTVKHKGAIVAAREGTYTITGAGANMWADHDAFHFLWRKASGDLSLTTRVAFPEKAGEAHRKAGWVVRQSLDADAPYADAIVHADGLVSLQYRLTKGGQTFEIQSPVQSPAAVRLDRTGDLFSLYVSREGKTWIPVGGVLVPLANPVHAGLAVCAHTDARTATAEFSHVEFHSDGVVAEPDRVLESTLEVIDIETGVREAVYTTRDHIEAPNWTRDGRSFLFNSGGLLYSLPRAGGTPTLIDMGAARRLNNDHGLSPDGRQIAISDQPVEDSLIFIVPADGGTPRQVTSHGRSYWHGWSPDG